MTIGMTYKESGKLENYLGGTVLEVEAAKDRFLTDAKDKSKKAVLHHIPHTSGKRRHAHRKPMHKDVQAQLVPDKIYGGKRVRVRGGRATGSIWHILNNGRHGAVGTHFMDKAISDIEAGLDPLLDAALSEEFK